MCFDYMFSCTVIDLQLDGCILDSNLVVLHQLDELVALRLLYRHVVALLLDCLALA